MRLKSQQKHNIVNMAEKKKNLLKVRCDIKKWPSNFINVLVQMYL